jgi:hypothetical protein
LTLAPVLQTSAGLEVQFAGITALSKPCHGLKQDAAGCFNVEKQCVHKVNKNNNISGVKLCVYIMTCVYINLYIMCIYTVPDASVRTTILLGGPMTKIIKGYKRTG